MEGAEFHWYFSLDRLSKDVTNPHPWVDSDGISRYAKILKEFMDEVASRAARLQAEGWMLKLHGISLAGCHDKFETREQVQHSLRLAGMDPSDVTIIMKKNKEVYDFMWG